jgi:hypothetical protein
LKPGASVVEHASEFVEEIRGQLVSPRMRIGDRKPDDNGRHSKVVTVGQLAEALDSPPRVRCNAVKIYKQQRVRS